LDEGKVEDLVASIRSIVSSNPELSEKIRIEADYFQKNTERTRYPKFRAQHLFVGSGVIEAGCKASIGSRCKQSGNVLDRARSERHPGIAKLSFQRTLRELLGDASPGGLIFTSTSRTRVWLRRRDAANFSRAGDRVFLFRAAVEIVIVLIGQIPWKRVTVNGVGGDPSQS
jgi:hypothetical protein